MYHLLIRAIDGTWDETPCEFERGRALREYTTGELSTKYSALTEELVDQIIAFPAIFAYESGCDGDPRIGWITRVRTRQLATRIEYRFERAIPPIPKEVLTRLKWELDIADREVYRTHWALKNVDLFPVLIEAGIVNSASIEALPPERRAIVLGAELHTTAIPAQSSVFRLPEAPIQANLVSIMMPFSADFSGVHRALIAGCERAGLHTERADNVWEESEIIQDIFSLIYRSRIVISDFSGRNPNVFYETGIAHTLGRPVIPIAQHESDVPFDLRHHRFIIYHDNEEGRSVLSDKIARRVAFLVRA